MEKSVPCCGKTWEISGEYFPNILGNNPGISLENSQNNPGKNAGISQEKSQKTSEKVQKMLVKKPPNSTNYDTDFIEYCCKTLKHLVVGDGAAIKLKPEGLVLKSNPDNPTFRLKYCPNCGTEIVHSDTNFVEETPEEPKELLHDNMDKKPPN